MTTYTYRDGKKIPLRKSEDEFTVRATADKENAVFKDKQPTRRVSAGSFKVKASPDTIEGLMTEARSRTVAHHVYKDEDDNEVLITDRILVEWADDADTASRDSVINAYGLFPVFRFPDGPYVYQLTRETGMNPVKLVCRLTEEEDAVALAEHDCNHILGRRGVDYYDKQWHLHEDFVHPEFDVRASAKVDDAWKITRGNDVVVCVTDDGCNLRHPDFEGVVSDWGYFRGSRLVVKNDPDADPDGMYISGDNHGTSCCGVIAADNDDDYTVGAAPSAKLLPIKWEGSGGSLFISDSKLMTVLSYIADKVDVMSNSWGATPMEMWSTSVRNYIDQLSKSGGRRGKGIVFLWAAGNENCPIDYSGDLDIPFSAGWSFNGAYWEWAGVATSRRFNRNLARLPGVMFIAALASTAKRAHYSNYGTGIALTAPSNNVHSYYRLSVAGLGIVTASSSAVTDSFGGTSSATPLVAGIAALVIAANPTLTAADVISILKSTASKDLDMAGYPQTPPASYDPDTSWDISPAGEFADSAFKDIGSPDGTWSPWFGHGKVDAFEAVKKASEMRGGVGDGDGGTEVLPPTPPKKRCRWFNWF